MKINVPSLRIWAWVGISFFLIQLYVIAYYKPPKNGNTYDLPISSLLNDIKNEFINKNKTTYNVIVVGTSLVGNGVECPDEIASTLTLANSKTRNILLKKILYNHDKFQYLFSNKNLINELLLIKPDLVCIQTELAAIRFEETEIFFYTNLESYLENLARKNAAFFKGLFLNKKSESINCKDNYINSGVLTDTLNYIPVKRYSKKNEEIQSAFEGLNKLSKAGIKIVIVDIPRPLQVEKIIYTKTFSKELDLLFYMYHQKFGIEHWKYTKEPLYFKDFYDGGHLNKAGRHLFTKYLLEKIINEIENKK